MEQPVFRTAPGIPSHFRKTLVALSGMSIRLPELSVEKRSHRSNSEESVAVVTETICFDSTMAPLNDGQDALTLVARSPCLVAITIPIACCSACARMRNDKWPHGTRSAVFLFRLPPFSHIATM